MNGSMKRNNEWECKQCKWKKENGRMKDEWIGDWKREWEWSI